MIVWRIDRLYHGKRERCSRGGIVFMRIVAEDEGLQGRRERVEVW